MIRFSAPILLALGIPLVLFVWWRLRALPAEHAGARRRIVQVLMGLGALAAALALAGVELGTPIDRLAVVFALDRSRSVERAGERASTDAVDAIRASIETMRADDRAGLVVFGAEAATEIVPSPSPPIAASRASVPRDATDIAGAIRRALADLPAEHAGRIVLVSDGVQTQGDALAAAAAAASRGVVVDVLAIDRAPAPEVAVEQVRIPETASPNEPIELRLVTRATRATDVRIRVTRDGATIAEAETRVREGEDVLVMRDVAPESGVHRYDVLVDPISAEADASRENNEGGAFLRVTGSSKVLVLAENTAHAEALAGAIRASGLEVDLRGVAGLPPDLATLASYDLVVLSDLRARRFTEAQMDELHAYVRDLGGGLLMVGTRDAFGLGGYAYTPIEEALPATFDLRRRRDRASLAMIIAIDKSGSMTAPVPGGRMKLDLANEAAARSAMMLSPFDRVGVMHVDTAVTWTVPMTPVENPEAIAATIRHAQPGGGGIFVDITMQASYERLRGESTQLKHLLLFSDGSDSENMSGTREQVAAAVRDHITTSIVSMGNGPDTPELERLSQIGGGRFYIVEDMTELPRIFTQETIEASRSAIVEEAFRPEPVAPGASTRGIDFAAGPALEGYVVVNARPRATVLLRAKDEDPLLAVWQHGIGRSAVFTCDAGSGLGRAWLPWPGYTQLFGQLARDLVRAPERRDARVSVRLDGGRGRILVEAVSDEGQYRNYLDLAATIAGPGGIGQDVDIVQTGAGRYEGTFDATAPGPYLVTVREEGRGLVSSAGLVRPAGDELRGEGTDRATLAQIAALTGGEVRPNLAEIFTDRPPPTYAWAPLWRWLVTFAICALLLSVALRRLVIPSGWWRRLIPSPVRKLFRMRTAGAARAEGTAATLEALAAARGRAAKKTGARQDVAPEIRAALDAKAAPDDATKRGSDGKDDGGEPPPAAPSAPASLAETLLERKKKKR